MMKHSFVVHSGDSMNGDVFFMEVSGQVNGRSPTDFQLNRTGIFVVLVRAYEGDCGTT